MRIDKFLKVSRILKRRTVAANAAKSDRVEINGKAAKPSSHVKIGDKVKIEFGYGALVFIVKGLNEKASKDEASLLYEIVES